MLQRCTHHVRVGIHDLESEDAAPLRQTQTDFRGESRNKFRKKILGDNTSKVTWPQHLFDKDLQNMARICVGRCVTSTIAGVVASTLKRTKPSNR